DGVDGGRPRQPVPHGRRHQQRGAGARAAGDDDGRRRLRRIRTGVADLLLLPLRQAVIQAGEIGQVAGEAFQQLDRRVEVDLLRALYRRAGVQVGARGGDVAGQPGAHPRQPRGAQFLGHGLRQVRDQRFHQRQHRPVAGHAQAVAQAMQRVEGGQRRHEGGVKGMQLARLRARMAGLKEGGGAARFQRGDVGGEFQMAQFRFGRRDAVLQHLAAKIDKAGVARLHGAHDGTRMTAREEHVVHDRRADDAQADLRDARDRQREHAGRRVHRRTAIITAVYPAAQS
ncbi:conserved hypothetical protein, partial [Ricinus communis]